MAKAKKSAKPPKARWVTQVELQHLTGWSRQTLAEWARRPGCPRKPKGSGWVYALPDFFDWKEREKVRAAIERQQPEPPTGRQDAERRRSAAEARMAEIKLEQIEGKLIPVEDVLKEYRALIDRVISLLRNHEKTRDVADELLTDLSEAPPPFEDPEASLPAAPAAA